MIWLVYNLFFVIGFILVLPYYLFRMIRRGGYWRDFEQRLGIYSSGIRRRLAETPRVWVHSVSVGELFVALSFIKAYRAAHPQQQFVLTVNTSTAHKLARERLDPRDVLLYFPVDVPWVIRRVLNRIRPVKLVLVECEIWPNLLRKAHRRGTELYLINGRLSDHSFHGYRRLKPWVRPVMQLFSAMGVQGTEDARRFAVIGAPPDRIHRLGSAKYDGALDSAVDAAAARAVLDRIQVPQDALILTAGSTWPGEERALLEACAQLKPEFPRLFPVLVPRHFERAPELLRLFAELKLKGARRSRLADESTEGLPDLLLVDTTGELMNFYAVADLVFVGKSLPPNRGGQNPIEPAALSRPVIVGPHMENFPAVMEDFKEADALRQIHSTEELVPVLRELLQDRERRRELGERAGRCVQARAGVLSRSVAQVLRNSGETE
jgi:3-deoxy-D-manno-octulosonic-acid transferase